MSLVIKFQSRRSFQAFVFNNINTLAWSWGLSNVIQILLKLDINLVFGTTDNKLYIVVLNVGKLRCFTNTPNNFPLAIAPKRNDSIGQHRYREKILDGLMGFESTTTGTDHLCSTNWIFLTKLKNQMFNFFEWLDLPDFRKMSHYSSVRIMDCIIVDGLQIFIYALGDQNVSTQVLCMSSVLHACAMDDILWGAILSLTCSLRC